MVVEGADDGSARFVWRTAGDAKEVRSVCQSPSGELGDVEIIGEAPRCPPVESPPVSLDRDGRGHTILARIGTNPSGLDVAHRAAEDNGWVPHEAVANGQLAARTNQTALVSETRSARGTWGGLR